MDQFEPGDFLVFQIESGFGLLRVLARDDGPETVWHVLAYSDLFMEVDQAVSLIKNGGTPTVSIDHVALTDRAFESTQVSKLQNKPLLPEETAAYEEWKASAEHDVSDRSIRLMLGLR